MLYNGQSSLVGEEGRRIPKRHGQICLVLSPHPKPFILKILPPSKKKRVPFGIEVSYLKILKLGF